MAWTVGAVGAFGPLAAIFVGSGLPAPAASAPASEMRSRIELCGRVVRYVPAGTEDGALVLDGKQLKLAPGVAVKDERMLALNRPVCVTGTVDRSDRLVECVVEPICSGQACGSVSVVEAPRTGGRVATK